MLVQAVTGRMIVKVSLAVAPVVSFVLLGLVVVATGRTGRVGMASSLALRPRSEVENHGYLFVLVGQVRRSSRRVRSWASAARAAFIPGAPWTPPPGWAEAEAR